MTAIGFIHGSVEFAVGALSRWRAAPLVSRHNDWPAAMVACAFDETTVAAVLDDAKDFGAHPDGQFVEILETERQVSVSASLESSLYGIYAHKLAASLRLAAEFGGEGEVRFSFFDADPDRLRLTRGKASVRAKPRAPADDEAARQAVLTRMQALLEVPAPRGRRAAKGLKNK